LSPLIVAESNLQDWTKIFLQAEEANNLCEILSFFHCLIFPYLMIITVKSGTDFGLFATLLFVCAELSEFESSAFFSYFLRLMPYSSLIEQSFDVESLFISITNHKLFYLILHLPL